MHLDTTALVNSIKEDLLREALPIIQIGKALPRGDISSYFRTGEQIFTILKGGLIRSALLIVTRNTLEHTWTGSRPPNPTFGEVLTMKVTTSILSISITNLILDRKFSMWRIIVKPTIFGCIEGINQMIHHPQEALDLINSKCPSI